MKKKMLLLPLLTMLVIGCSKTGGTSGSGSGSGSGSSSSRELTELEKQQAAVREYFAQDALSFAFESTVVSQFDFEEEPNIFGRIVDMKYKKTATGPLAYATINYVDDESNERWYYQDGVSYSYEELVYGEDDKYEYYDMYLLSFDSFKMESCDFWMIQELLVDSAKAIKSNQDGVVSFDIDVEDFANRLIRRSARMMSGSDFDPAYYIETSIDRLIAVGAMGDIDFETVDFSVTYTNNKISGMSFEGKYVQTYGDQAQNCEISYDVTINDTASLVIASPVGFDLSETKMIAEIFDSLQNHQFDVTLSDGTKFAYNTYFIDKSTKEAPHEEIQQSFSKGDVSLYYFIVYGAGDPEEKLYSTSSLEDAMALGDEIVDTLGNVSSLVYYASAPVYTIDFDGVNMTLTCVSEGEFDAVATMTYNAGNIVINTFKWRQAGETAYNQITTRTPVALTVPAGTPELEIPSEPTPV